MTRETLSVDDATRSGNGRSLRIAVADDVTLHSLYEEFLSQRGHQVYTGRTGRQLIELCQVLRPDLILVDPQLPEMDGVLREVGQDPPIPLILVARSHEDESFARALANPHVLACLVKPIKEADLEFAIV